MPDPRDRERTPATGPNPPDPKAGDTPKPPDNPPDTPAGETIPGGKYRVQVGTSGKTKLVNAHGQEITEDGKLVNPDDKAAAEG
jgi:hypothetical protein